MKSAASTMARDANTYAEELTGYGNSIEFEGRLRRSRRLFAGAIVELSFRGVAASSSYCQYQRYVARPYFGELTIRQCDTAGGARCTSSLRLLQPQFEEAHQVAPCS